jgi:hypothetical protein
MRLMKTLSVCLWMAALSATASACLRIFPEWKRGPSFSVLVTMNGVPVPHMRVLLQPQADKRLRQIEIISDDSGVADFREIKPGRYYLLASRLGLEVGPGTVMVSPHGIAEQIGVEWPLSPAYTVTAIAGRFQRHLYPKQNPIDGYVHPQIGPIAGAKLTLKRIDFEKQIGIVVTDSNGNFDFRTVEPGAYLLHIEENNSEELAYPIDDYLLVYVDPSSNRGDLRLQVDWTSCGIKTTDIR